MNPLNMCFKTWCKITENPVILDWVKFGVKLLIQYYTPEINLPNPRHTKQEYIFSSWNDLIKFQFQNSNHIAWLQSNVWPKRL